MPPPMTERNRQRIVLAALARDYPVGRVFHVPNGGKRDLREAGELKKDGVKAGVHDLVVVRPNKRVSWIEMKDDKGVLSKEQKQVHAEWLDLGHVSYVVRCLDDLWPIIELWKLEDANTPSTPREGS